MVDACVTVLTSRFFAAEEMVSASTPAPRPVLAAAAAGAVAAVGFGFCGVRRPPRPLPDGWSDELELEELGRCRSPHLRQARCLFWSFSGTGIMQKEAKHRCLQTVQRCRLTSASTGLPQSG